MHAWFNRYARHEANGLDELEAVFEEEYGLNRRQVWRWLPYVAAVLMVGFTWYFFNIEKPAERGEPNSLLVANDVPPGGNRAILTVADGRSIELSESQSGIVVGDKHILYASGSEKLIDLVDEEVVSLELTTTAGGTYQVVLTDGTKVWLNAASTLRYPSRFANGERIVEIVGEAYFSVAKDGQRPFKVISDDQQIEVLGTEFNVSAYAGEGEIRTTLVEGSIELRINEGKKHMTLSPNEQSVFFGTTITKSKVDVGPYVAWKDGNFYFDNTALADMMNQMARWYDVEVIYESGVPNERFSGAMSRNVSLQTVLELLRISEIKYRIEKNKLIIE